MDMEKMEPRGVQRAEPTGLCGKQKTGRSEIPLETSSGMERATSQRIQEKDSEFRFLDTSQFTACCQAAVGELEVV